MGPVAGFCSAIWDYVSNVWPSNSSSDVSRTPSWQTAQQIVDSLPKQGTSSWTIYLFPSQKNSAYLDFSAYFRDDAKVSFTVSRDTTNPVQEVRYNEAGGSPRGSRPISKANLMSIPLKGKETSYAATADLVIEYVKELIIGSKDPYDKNNHN